MSESVAETVAEVRSSFNELIRQADRRGSVPGWPTTSQIRSFRYEFDTWVSNSGADSERPSPTTFEIRYQNKPVLPTIKLSLSTLNFNVRMRMYAIVAVLYTVLTMIVLDDFRRGPHVVKGASAMEAVETVENTLDFLASLTHPSRHHRRIR